eukprot:GILJ01004517.1.p1 GENE.GILJ01004517.1~~GILJ01004517.1.p1  ORF type:complete len:355 (-),score=24.51 GILJ01004517.1:214-1242(-)
MAARIEGATRSRLDKEDDIVVSVDVHIPSHAMFEKKNELRLPLIETVSGSAPPPKQSIDRSFFAPVSYKQDEVQMYTCNLFQADQTPSIVHIAGFCCLFFFLCLLPLNLEHPGLLSWAIVFIPLDLLFLVLLQSVVSFLRQKLASLNGLGRFVLISTSVLCLASISITVVLINLRLEHVLECSWFICLAPVFCLLAVLLLFSCFLFPGFILLGQPGHAASLFFGNASLVTFVLLAILKSARPEFEFDWCHVFIPLWICISIVCLYAFFTMQSRCSLFLVIMLFWTMAIFTTLLALRLDDYIACSWTTVFLPGLVMCAAFIVTQLCGWIFAQSTSWTAKSDWL